MYFALHSDLSGLIGQEHESHGVIDGNAVPYRVDEYVRTTIGCGTNRQSTHMHNRGKHHSQPSR